MNCRFRWPVRVCVKDRCSKPIDGADIHDTRGVIFTCPSLEKGQKLLGEKEHSLDVGVEHLVPPFFGELFNWSTPRHASVVDEDVNLRFALSDGAGKSGDALHR